MLSIGMAAMLTLMWLRRIAAGLGETRPSAALDGETTMVVQALDLGLVVPSLVLSGIVAWRRSLVGPLLAAVLCVAFMTMAARDRQHARVGRGWCTGTLDIPPLAIFCAAALAPRSCRSGCSSAWVRHPARRRRSHRTSRPSPTPAMTD